MDVFNFGARQLGPLRCRARLGAIKQAVQAVFCTSRISRGGSSAQYGNSGIYLRAVGIDDYAVGSPGKCNRKCRLAARGRSRN